MFASLKTSMPATLDVFKVVVFICLFHDKLKWYLKGMLSHADIACVQTSPISFAARGKGTTA